jgi:hypothetical protein
VPSKTCEMQRRDCELKSRGAVKKCRQLKSFSMETEDGRKALVHSVVLPQSSPRAEVMSHDSFVELLTAIYYPCACDRF